jgi:hypothetical protein
MHGAGYEYLGRDAERDEVVMGSRPVEELLFDPPTSLKRRSPALVNAGQHITIIGPTFNDLLPVRLVRQGDITLINITAQTTTRGGVWKRFVSFAKIAANRTIEYWSPENAVAEARDEVTVARMAIRDRGSRRIGEFIEDVSNRYVLVLGDYSTEGRQRLALIREAVEVRGYKTMLVDEVPEMPQYDLRHKVNMLAGICRFVVVDDSSKAGHIAELQMIDSDRVIAGILRLEGSDTSYMNRGLSATSRVITEVTYTPASLDDAVAHLTTWAEETRTALEAFFTQAYPWRGSRSEP